MKLTKTQEKTLAGKILHITGECMCKPTNTKCSYWKFVDKGGADWQTKEIIKAIKALK